MDLDILTKLDLVKKLQKLNRRIAIHAVLPDVFEWALKAKPKLIVELGVSKEALANQVLAMVAEVFGSVFISCDLYDFDKVCSYEKWYFIQAHDVEFARVFGEYCASIGVDPLIDLLFVDTDELYPHSLKEIQAWYPYLNARATVMHRCTNLKKQLIYRNGDRTGLGWDNQRGVIRAIEEHFGITMEEGREYHGLSLPDGWEVHHLPWGAGLTVLRKGF